MKKSLFIELTVSDNCNCNCAYCFEGKHPCVKPNLQVQEQQLKLIVEACQTFDKDKFNDLTVSFWGGEPFMDLEFIDKIISATRSFSFVHYHCYSNGTLVDKYKQFLSRDYMPEVKDRLHIQLSYDGEPHHTIKRGNNSDKIFEVAKMLQDAGIFFQFKATLSYDMIRHLPEIWDSYEALFSKFSNLRNMRQLVYYPTLDTCSTDEKYLDDWKEALEKIVKKEYQFYKKHNFFLFDWFSATSRRVNCNLDHSIHMHTDGNIYICHGCAYIQNNSKLKIGNIYSIKSLHEVLSEKYGIAEIPTQCKKCNSTHCQVCHVENLKEDDDPYENWIKCRVNNISRCKFFKVFGHYSNLLKFALTKNGKFYGIVDIL